MLSRVQVANLWRQWERFTVSGFRIHTKRYSAVQGLVTWLLLLISLYALRLFAKSSTDWDDDAQSAMRFWHNRRLVFCISPGRSGSLHLRNVLDVADDTRSFHEPEPKMTGNIFKSVFLQGKRAETFESRSDYKLEAIREQLEGTLPTVTYAETSHMFVKMFADVVLHHLADVANITIIVLHRPLHRIVWSQLSLGWFSLNHSGLHEWYYDISEINENEQVVSLQLNFSSPIDRAIGYNTDVLQRGADLRHHVQKQQQRGRWQKVRFVDANITDLSSTTGVSTFLRKLGLRVDQRRLQLLSLQDENERELKKDRVQNDITMADVSHRIVKLREEEDLPER